jgi:hypothetical protein
MKGNVSQCGNANHACVICAVFVKLKLWLIFFMKAGILFDMVIINVVLSNEVVKHVIETWKAWLENEN